MSEPASKSLIFCVHAHQPVGNFDSVFADAFEKSYRPFFEVLESHPKIKISAHFSGSLLDWLQKNRPDFLKNLRKVHEKGQLEFLGGGYYEPIFGMISKKDLAGQIALMRKKLWEFFGAEFQGVWLTERVWDPELTGLLAKSGVQYTILDDYHFENRLHRNGSAQSPIADPVTGYYQSKAGRDKLDLFASMKHLRYLIPFRRAEEALQWMHETPAQAGDVFTFADDIEKFGFWPGTYDWVYKEKWLDQFWTLLENQNEIKLHSFADYRKNFKPKRTVEIDHASYTEMMEWSGGRFYNFFDKYPESRYMRDRMKSVSARAQGSPKALESLYRAQCNCSYWHGVFGGLYLHHLRSAIFENLIQADQILDKKPGISEEKVGTEKYFRIRQKNTNAFFNPAYGAALEELDYTPKSVNLMCNIHRQKEPYHHVAAGPREGEGSAGAPMSIHEILGVKEKDLEKHLHYDAFKRVSFLDHCLIDEISLDEFILCSYQEMGDFAGKKYSSRLRSVKGRAALEFSRKSWTQTAAGKLPVSITKTIVPKNESLEARYTVKNLSRQTLSFTLGVEFNFSIGDTKAMQRIEKQQSAEWTFHDSWRDIPIRLTMKPEAALMAGPIETVSESESGLERTFQELGVLTQTRIHLEPGQSQEQVFELAVG